jgi:hypothetical protein
MAETRDGRDAGGKSSFVCPTTLPLERQNKNKNKNIQCFFIMFPLCTKTALPE